MRRSDKTAGGRPQRPNQKKLLVQLNALDQDLSTTKTRSRSELASDPSPGMASQASMPPRFDAAAGTAGSGATGRDGFWAADAVSWLWRFGLGAGLAAGLGAGSAVGGGDAASGPRSAEASAAALLASLSVAALLFSYPYVGMGTAFMRPMRSAAWYSRAETSQPGDQPSVSSTAACRMRSCTREPG